MLKISSNLALVLVLANVFILFMIEDNWLLLTDPPLLFLHPPQLWQKNREILRSSPLSVKRNEQWIR